MTTSSSERPWMIEFGPLEKCRGFGKGVLDIIVEVAKARCDKVNVTIHEEFYAGTKEKGMEFQRAEIWCGFFFKTSSATYNIRLHTEVWADIGQSIFFAFEEGELGGGGYGTDWEKRSYDKIMEYPFFKDAYEAFVKDVMAKIQERIPGILA